MWTWLFRDLVDFLVIVKLLSGLKRGRTSIAQVLGVTWKVHNCDWKTMAVGLRLLALAFSHHYEHLSGLPGLS